METKHTPGPWCAFAGFVAAETTEGKKAVCKMSYPGAVVFAAECGTLEDSANARLIAAAPNMLKALQQIVADYDYEKGNCKPHTLAGHAKRAIEQATGE